MKMTLILFHPTVSPAGQYVKGAPSKPLHQCSLYGSKEAGAKLGEMLKMGTSRHWKEVTSIEIRIVTAGFLLASDLLI